MKKDRNDPFSAQELMVDSAKALEEVLRATVRAALMEMFEQEKRSLCVEH